jgi:DNA mismatch repair protein MutL
MIHRLTAETVGKIAAGEVIERPAAAVKELVENALDAGATRVHVAIGAGGVDALEVRDNGCGMSLEELPLAVERHATSKIASLDDLRTLSTLGFRGEALASLAAVSDLRITSLAAGHTVGGAMRVVYGQPHPPKPVAWSQGTAVVARDLFGNVPARRKFLKQPQTESNYVSRTVAAYALAYPHVAFTLEIDGRNGFTTDGSGDALNAAVAVWGAEVAGDLTTIHLADGEHDGFDVQGVVSLPPLHRATRQQQFLFAQGRLIASRQIATAFEQAYHTLLMVGRHPLGCIQVRVPADRIDVNVHPTKAEVRFADERLVFSLVQRAVREAILQQGSHGVPLTVMSAPLIDQTVQRRLALSHPSHNASIAGGLLSREPAEPEHPATAPIPESPRRSLPVLRVLGQIAATFIVAEGPDGMYLVDQHAAHERILFEQLMAEHEARRVDRQLLLQPVTVEMPPREWEVFMACRAEMEAFGFDLDEFGGSTIVVRAVPAILKIRDAARTILTILEELAEGGRGQTRLESLAISAACHTSIRAGQALTLLEMRELVAQLEACSSPLACGHGRPTMLRMSAEDLERQFARR